jgi:lysophospholipase L1-like esterase
MFFFVIGSSLLMWNRAAFAQSPSSTDVTDLIVQSLWAGINGNFDSLTIQPVNDQLDDASAAPSTSTAPNLSGGQYAALGDSVAAGVGLTTPLSVPQDQTRCGRTAESYPVLVSQSLNMKLVDAACSGATAGDILTQQRDGSPNQPSQLSTVYASGQPDLMTITAGANDVHWQQFLFSCYYSDCSTSASSATAATYRGLLRAKLFTLFTDIRLRSNGHPPTVIYTGYYNPVSAACQGRINNITPAEITFFAVQVNALNATIQSVASHYSFVRFVPVDFSGHDICSMQPWVQGLSDPQPIHPTSAGQQAIARAILSNLSR